MSRREQDVPRIVWDTESGRGWDVFVPPLEGASGAEDGYIDTKTTLAEAASLLLTIQAERAEDHLKRRTQALLAQEVELLRLQAQADKALENLDSAKQVAETAINHAKEFVEKHEHSMGASA